MSASPWVHRVTISANLLKVRKKPKVNSKIDLEKAEYGVCADRYPNDACSDGVRKLIFCPTSAMLQIVFTDTVAMEL